MAEIKPSDQKQIKFNIESGRESFFTAIIASGLLVALMSCCILTRYNSSNTLLLIAVCGYAVGVIFTCLRASTDDYLMFDSHENAVMMCKNFPFFKSRKKLYSFKDIKGLELKTKTRTTESGGRYSKTKYYTDYFISLVMEDKIIESCEKASIEETNDNQFAQSIARLRDKAVEISGMAGCSIDYSDKIPPEERLQFASVNLAIENSARNVIEESTLQENIQSDFIYYGEKTCPSCDSKVPVENEFCINCGKKI